MPDILTVIIITAAATAAATYYGLPALAASCDRRRWFIAVRKRRRQLRLATTRSTNWHTRAKYARLVGQERRAERAAMKADAWDERLAYIADSDNIDWLPPSWLPVLPVRERGPQPSTTPRKARWAPPLDIPARGNLAPAAGGRYVDTATGEMFDNPPATKR